MRLVEAVYKRIENLAKERTVPMSKMATMSGIPRTTLISIPKVKTVTLATIYGVSEDAEITLKEFFDSPLFDRENITD